MKALGKPLNFGRSNKLTVRDRKQFQLLAGISSDRKDVTSVASESWFKKKTCCTLRLLNYFAGVSRINLSAWRCQIKGNSFTSHHGIP